MTTAIVVPEVPGHLNPATCLGRELSDRGETVCLVGSEKVRPWAVRTGLHWLPVHGFGEAEAAWKKAGELSGLNTVRQSGRALAEASKVLRRELPFALRGHGVKRLLVDQFSPAGAVVAENVGLSYVVLCNALACYVNSSVPPASIGLRHRRGWLARARNRIAGELVLGLFDTMTETRRGSADSPLLLLDGGERYGLAHVAQQPGWFAFDGERMPAHFHPTAPWHTTSRDDHVPFPWERLDGRPLVYASMGTLQNRIGRVFAEIAEAARGVDAQFVLSLGGGQAWQLGLSVPENVIVVPYAPQLRLLERAALTITHAGLNTTLECLAHGVPMVTLPVAHDQPGVARRAEALGASEFLPVQRVTAPRLRRLVERVLKGPQYHTAARLCRASLSRLDGVSLAADVIEAAFRTNRRVCRQTPTMPHSRRPLALAGV